MRWYLSFLIALALPLAAFAADTGWVLCGTAADAGSGDESWSSVGNAAIDDTSEASCEDLGTGDETNRLRATNFPWTIPDGATIDGIEFRHEVRANNSNDMERVQVFLVIGGVLSSRQITLSGVGLTSSAVVYTEGSDSPTGSGGFEPSVEELNASNFGFQTYYADNGGGSGDSVWVRRVWARVTYTEGGGEGEGEGEGEADTRGFFALTR